MKAICILQKLYLNVLIFFQASNMQYIFCDVIVTTPSSHSVTRINNPFGSIKSFCLLLPVLYSINYMIYPTLHYKIGFLLDDSAQPQANVYFLRSLRQAKLSYDVWQIMHINEFLIYSIFNLDGFINCIISQGRSTGST